MGTGHFGQNEPKKGELSTWRSRLKFFVREGVPRVVDPGGPPRVGDPPYAGLFFFHLPHNPPRATWDFFFGPRTILHPPPRANMGLFFPNAPQMWPQKGPLGPFWRSNLVPWQATAPRRSVYCAPAWPGRAPAPRVHPAERSDLARQLTGTVSAPCRKAPQARRAASCLESVFDL